MILDRAINGPRASMETRTLSQEELGRFLAEYVGFDFDRGVMAVSAHPFTTNLHNKDVRITTHYTDCVDSSLFSVIHEAGHDHL